MKNSLLALILGAVAATSAQAQIVNPDNDSAAFFAQRKSAPTTPKPVQQSPKVGDISPDGLYVFVGGDRGWVHQVHRYDITGGKVAHQTDGLTHDGPKPAKGGPIVIQAGPFAERGA